MVWKTKFIGDILGVFRDKDGEVRVQIPGVPLCTRWNICCGLFHYLLPRLEREERKRSIVQEQGCRTECNQSPCHVLAQ